jgi:uncharacterized protein
MLWEKPSRQTLLNGATHMQHGPIDLVLNAWGAPDEVSAAVEAAWARMQSILPELAGELPELRKPAGQGKPATLVGRRMSDACALFWPAFLTPMAAVAGAVADELIATMTAAADIDRAYVNDGGDIALHLKPGQALKLGVFGDYARNGPVPVLSGTVEIRAEHPVRGVATSGARGRSFSLGIADSVTVLARTAASADAAASLIANAVDADHPGIVRRPAVALDPDSDLGERMVTLNVPPLADSEIDHALRQGLAVAAGFREQGLISDAALSLHGRTMTLAGTLASSGLIQTGALP